MEYRFNADEWRTLRPPERVLRCKLLAQQARDLARGAKPDSVRAYLQIAEGWEQLANESNGQIRDRRVSGPRVWFGGAFPEPGIHVSA